MYLVSINSILAATGGMESFLGIGAAKRHKVERHQLVEDSLLQPVVGW